jgi:DNA-binding CsgD family transcriptional regulator
MLGTADGERAPADWYGTVPQLIEAVGSSALPALLDEALRAVASFDLTAIFAYSGPQLRPSFLHDGLSGTSPAAVLKSYLEGAYLLDAVYTACTHDIAPGLYRLAQLAPDAFFEGEYYNSPDVHPCISLESGSLAEEIVFLARFDGGAYVAYSLMRSNGWSPFSDQEFASLAQCEPIVRSLLRRHWAPLDREQTGPAPREEGAVLEDAFRTFGADRLSLRERAVVSLILRGHSSLSIANVLGISEGTVKNHRKSIHAKLGISSQSELFARFVHHLLLRR